MGRMHVQKKAKNDLTQLLRCNPFAALMPNTDTVQFAVFQESHHVAKATDTQIYFSVIASVQLRSDFSDFLVI